MFKGTYVFKENGIEIGRSQNLITDNGRDVILRYIAGATQSWASNLAIGAMPIQPTQSDTDLNFETARVPIDFKTYRNAISPDPDLIIVRGTLPQNLYANIYEVGVYPDSSSTSLSAKSNAILADFDNISNWNVSAGNVSITNFMPQAENSPRIGAHSVELDPETIYENATVSFDIGGYTPINNLEVLLYNTVEGVLTITLTDLLGASMSFTFNLVTEPGYQVLSAPFSPGAHLFETIDKISISTDTTAIATIDAIKATTRNEFSTKDYIVSKSALTTPIAKKYGVPLDIEYSIQLL